MTFSEAVVLAVLQGLTEFLPISSSGHLVLVPALLGWDDQGLAFDIAVHFGTLVAVLVYFRTDLAAMLASLGSVLAGRPGADGRLALQLILASIPLGLAGLIFADFVETELRSPLVIAATTAIFGLTLLLSDWFGRRSTSERGLTWTGALIIGCAQALALIPGTSRSGITINAALVVGLTREAASRFSFLLAIPAIVMASGWQSLQLIGSAVPLPWPLLLTAMAVSAAVAFVTIAMFLKLIERIGMIWFALYRFALAGILVYVFA
jgi:undecaprenyl-diphosphatase